MGGHREIQGKGINSGRQGDTAKCGFQRMYQHILRTGNLRFRLILLLLPLTSFSMIQITQIILNPRPDGIFPSYRVHNENGSIWIT
jgi:hypothetical protein